MPKRTGKRSREAPFEELNSSAEKRQKMIADDLICPINLTLPLDPVTAEDGRVYERIAIERYIESKRGEYLVSPVTKSKMGANLFPVIQIKNHIETLVESGMIVGQAAEDWKERATEKKKRDDLVKRAEQGEEVAVEEVAHYYYHGTYGFPKNLKLAFKWVEKGQKLQSVHCTALKGRMLVAGEGVNRDVAKGMMYLGWAEAFGSDLAAYMLGKLLHRGLYGVSADKVEAKALFERALSEDCPERNLSEPARVEVRKMLDEINHSCLSSSLSE